MDKKPSKKGQVVDQSELVEFLSKKFDLIDGRFDEIDGRFTSMFRSLQGAVDGLAHQHKTYFQEMTMLTSQVRRHDKLIDGIIGG